MDWQETLQKIVRTNEPYSLSKSKNEFEIMQHFLNNESVRKDILQWFESLEYNNLVCKKNSDKSKELRKRGNTAFENKKYELSIMLYNSSMQMAPWESEDLTLAVANRSAALFYTEKYESCTRDIQLAIQWNYPENLIYKLYLRAAQCYFKLHQKRLMEEALSKLQISLNNNVTMEASKKEFIKKQMDLLLAYADNSENIKDVHVINHQDMLKEFSENPNFPNASTALNLQFSEMKGRYVVATRNIKKGEILFFEKPFAFVLLDNKDSMVVCTYCCEGKGDTPIPCTFCTTAVYCTKKCQMDAWSTYHQWECFGNQIGMWDQIGIAHLTIRTFLISCYTNDEAQFNAVQKLVTNMAHISNQDMFLYSISALMMTMYLRKFTKFFRMIDVCKSLFLKFDNEELNMSKVSELQSTEWTEGLSVHYVSGILLRHMLQLICNGHAITRLNISVSNAKNISTEYQCRIATAIYPAASMMNHSCDPNIINSFKGQHLIVKSIKDIPCNGEILNCYGPHYRKMKKQERHEALEKQYCFVCDCKACTHPLLQNFCDRFRSLRCKECNGPLKEEKNVLTCLDCKLPFHLNFEILQELKEANVFYKIAQDYIEKNNLKMALEKAKYCLDIRKKHLFRLHEDVTLTYDLISKILAISGRWIESILYLEFEIVAVKERFGCDSIELANELNKITDICFQYLSQEKDLNTKQCKKVIKKTRQFLNQATEILELNYGPWNEVYIEINEKQRDLVLLLASLNL